MQLGGPHCGALNENSPGCIFIMYLLYLDDAGSTQNPNEEYLVLGGLAIYEAQAHFFTQELDKLAESINPSDPSMVEFHASEIFARRVFPWDRMQREEAKGVIKAVLRIIQTSYNTTNIFACAIHKKSFPQLDSMQVAFEDLCSRFDLFLGRLRDTGERQRGLLILDNCSYESIFQKMSEKFKKRGTQWGRLCNLAETPLFVDSKASRLVQVADHIAYAVFRRYNAADTSYMDIIASRFFLADGTLHGLAHKQTIDPQCMCPACFSRR
jgi:hypothetical protein